MQFADSLPGYEKAVSRAILRAAAPQEFLRWLAHSRWSLWTQLKFRGFGQKPPRRRSLSAPEGKAGREEAPQSLRTLEYGDGPKQTDGISTSTARSTDGSRQRRLKWL